MTAAGFASQETTMETRDIGKVQSVSSGEASATQG